MPSEARSYQIEHALGKGGFGTVYRAKLLGAGGFSKQVAIKLLNADMEGMNEVAKRMRDEARMLGLLRHRAIVQVDGLVMLEGRWAIVMEYVEGVDLSRFDAPMPSGPALEIITEVAGALHVAYDRPSPSGQPLKLLHRDIKPQNIQLTSHGEVKVLDFGIARADFDSREAVTKAMMFGSQKYMAPERLDLIEQHEGDIYSLGVVLFELLTATEFGKAAVEEGRHETRMIRARRQLAALNVPRHVVDLFSDMMGYEPEDRPSAKEVARRARVLVREIDDDPLVEWAETWVPRVPERSEVLSDEMSGRVLVEQRTGGTPAPIPSRQVTPSAMSTMPPDDEPEQRDDPGTTWEQGPPPTKAPRQATPAPAPSQSMPVPEHATPAPAPHAVPQQPHPSHTGAVPRRQSGVNTVAVAAVGGGVGAIVAGSLLVAIVAVGGAILYTQVAVPADDEPDTVEVAEDDTDEEPEVIDEVDDDDSEEAEEPDQPRRPRRPKTVVTVPGSSDDASVEADATDDTTLPEVGAAGEYTTECGTQAELESQARFGKLPQGTLTCLEGSSMDASRELVLRRRDGVIALVQHRAACSAGAGCTGYERYQRQYFEDLDQSDANLLLNFADHLYRKGGKTRSNQSEVIKWAERALERKSEWKSTDFVRNVDRSHELRARSSYEIWSADMAAGASSEVKSANRAKVATSDWLAYRVSIGKDATQPRQLCRSVSGNSDICERDLQDRNRKTVVTLVSQPMGAELFVDGKSIGKAPSTPKLGWGGHEIRMVLSDGTASTQSIRVGDKEPTRWVWKSGDDSWVSGF